MEKACGRIDPALWRQSMDEAVRLAAGPAGADGAALRQISLLGCYALKAGLRSEAEEAFRQLAALADRESQAYARTVRNMLVAAARAGEAKLFTDWLGAAEQLAVRLTAAGRGSEAGEMLLELAYATCDRRFTAARALLQQMVLRFARQQRREPCLSGFFNEWGLLAAQFLRRQWPEEGRFLLSTLLHALLRTGDAELFRAVLMQLELHMQLYSYWDGLSGACRAYRQLHYFLLLLVKRALRATAAQEERERCLLLVLRAVRSLLLNAARATMSGEGETLRQWSRLLAERLPERLRVYAELLAEMDYFYWSRTMPATGRRQLAACADLPQSGLFSDELRETLCKFS